MTDEQKPQVPKDWTIADVTKAAAEIVGGIGKLIGDSGLNDAPSGKKLVLEALMGCAAYFADLESISRHDFIDKAKTTFDAVAAQRQHEEPPAS